MNTSKNETTCQTVTYFSVYVLWCRKTDMHYVDVTRQKVTTRIRQHKKGKQFVDKEVKRVGWEGNWDYWIVEEHVPANLISDCEQRWIKFFDCIFPKGYNKTGGGIGKIIVTDDTREKIRRNALARDMNGERNPNYGRRHSDEAREAIRQSRLGKSSWNKGIPCSEEQKANLREKALAKDMSGENNPFHGKHHTEEAKEKNRQAHLGKPSWNKGVPCSEATKAKLREKALARHAEKRVAKAVAEENLAAANTTPTNLSTLLDAVILQKCLSSKISVA